jgi:hypothetical protein
MPGNGTTRGGLTLAIGVGYGALKLAARGFSEARQSAASFSRLEATSEKLLQVQLVLGRY